MANQQAQSQQTNVQQGKVVYFDLHVSGIGYLNRIREVQVNNGNRKARPFWSCGISALHGASNGISYTPFDVIISGEEALSLVQGVQHHVQAKRKVLVSFKVGDIYPYWYHRDARDKNGNKTGGQEIATGIKGRLLLIYMIKVDGKVVYRRPRGDQAQTGQQQANGDPQSAQPAAAERPMPAMQPQCTGAERSQQGAPAQVAGEQMNVEPAYPQGNDWDDDIPF